MVYTRDLKSLGRKSVRVQVPPEVQLKGNSNEGGIAFCIFRTRPDSAKLSPARGTMTDFSNTEGTVYLNAILALEKSEKNSNQKQPALPSPRARPAGR